MRRLQQHLARRLRRLEEIAEQVVVFDLELADARLFGVARLHFGDHPPAFVAQARALRRARRCALARTNPPSRLLSGRSSASVAASSRAELAVVAFQPRIGVDQRGGQRRPPSPVAPRPRRSLQARRAAPARSRGPPRSSAEPRQRAQEIGRRRQASRAARRATRGASTKNATASWRRADLVDVGERARQPLGDQPRAGGRLGQIDGGEHRAGALARKRARQLQIGARRGVDFQACSARPARRRARAAASRRSGCA